MGFDKKLNKIVKDKNTYNLEMDNLKAKYLGAFPTSVSKNNERIILGEEICSTMSRIMICERNTKHVTGEIGYLDFQLNKRFLYMSGIGIEPKYQGNGFSKKLIKALEKVGRKRGVHKIIAEVDNNNISMKKIMQKCNFKMAKKKFYGPVLFLEYHGFIKT